MSIKGYINPNKHKQPDGVGYTTMRRTMCDKDGNEWYEDYNLETGEWEFQYYLDVDINPDNMNKQVEDYINKKIVNNYLNKQIDPVTEMIKSSLELHKAISKLESQLTSKKPMQCQRGIWCEKCEHYMLNEDLEFCELMITCKSFKLKGDR